MKNYLNRMVCAFLLLFSVNTSYSFTKLEEWIRLCNESTPEVKYTCKEIIYSIFSNDDFEESDNTIIFKKADKDLFNRESLVSVFFNNDRKIYLGKHSKKFNRKIFNRKNLNLSNRKILNLEPLKYFKKLRKIDLSFNEIEDFSPVLSLSKITHIILNNNRIKEVDVTEKLKNLVKLDLSHNQISRISLNSNSPNIKDLILSNNLIYNLDFISEVSTVEIIDLSFNNISSISITGELKKLKKLNLSNNQIGDCDEKRELLLKLNTTEIDFRNNYVPTLRSYSEYNEQLGEIATKTCSICLKELHEDNPDKVIAVNKSDSEIKCKNKHVFHKECISLWINGGDDRVCPTCRGIYK